MRFRRLISTLDYHTAGGPARVVIGGVPTVPGKTMVDKWLWAQKNLDELRTFLMYEPRGHASMSGSIITAPTSPDADVGVLFIEVTGFLPMCGHMTIATSSALVEAGLVPVTEPVTRLSLDTPAGLVKVEVSVEEGVAKDVTFRNVPAFVYKRDLSVEVPTLGTITLDIVWGGNFYAIVPAASVGLEIVPERTREIVERGTQIREAIFEQVEVVHPLNPAINRCDHVRFIGPPKNPSATTQNVVFCSVEAIDRSPCGTGTSAEMALRFSRGQLRLGEEFTSESIMGSLFHGRVVEETRVGSFPAVIPIVCGSAYPMGIQQFVLDARDPWPRGFYLGPKSKWGAEF